MKLIDLAKVIRTKNSGPFVLTIDIIFREREIYEMLKKRDLFSKTWFSDVYGVNPEEIISVIYFDPVCAIKANIKRRVPSGSPGDSDVYGAQQHAPLLEVEIDV